MIGVIEYYLKPPKDYRTTYFPGQFFWAPIPFVPNTSPQRLKLDYFDPKKPDNANFTLHSTDFSQVPYRDDPPLRHIGLSQSEVLIANPFKRRPVVIVSDHLSRPGEPVQNNPGYLVAPSYSIRDEAGNYRAWVTTDVVKRAKAYQYPNIFYLPPSGEFGIAEAFLRFDRLQFVRIEHLDHQPVALTPDAIGIAREWLYYYLGCPLLNPALEKFIEVAAAKLSEERNE